jgi:hypothetical protein
MWTFKWSVDAPHQQGKKWGIVIQKYMPHLIPGDDNETGIIGAREQRKFENVSYLCEYISTP